MDDLDYSRNGRPTNKLWRLWKVGDSCLYNLQPSRKGLLTSTLAAWFVRVAVLTITYTLRLLTKLHPSLIIILMKIYLCTLSKVFLVNFRWHVFWIPAIAMRTRILKAEAKRKRKRNSSTREKQEPNQLHKMKDFNFGMLIPSRK